MENKLVWSIETPTEIGLYLYYGYRFKGAKKLGGKREILFVKAVLTGNDKLILIANNGFMWDSERGEGVFTKFPDGLQTAAQIAFALAFPE